VDGKWENYQCIQFMGDFPNLYGKFHISINYTYLPIKSPLSRGMIELRKRDKAMSGIMMLFLGIGRFEVDYL